MSQFTKYTSSDAGAPALNGTAGSLIAVLDFVLITGQGWTHPVATVTNIASYKQHTDAIADFGFVLNDNAPVSGDVAFATGWKSVAGVGSPVGSGSGQFPTAAQLGTTGHVWIKKSFTADSVIRPWIAFADHRTFYLFVTTGDTTVRYCTFGFGEFYSYYGSGDVNNCFLEGRTVTTSTLSASNGGLDKMITPLIGSNNGGCYFADNYASSSGSQICYPCGDLSKQDPGVILNTNTGSQTYGFLTGPNMADNAFYIAPIYLSDSSYQVRGRYRGLYHLCHRSNSFADGATLTGSGAYAGKTFLVLSQTLSSAGGFFCIETSNTLDTN